MSTSASKSNYPSKVVWPFRCKWTVDTLPHGQKLLFKCRLKLRAPISLKQKALFILLECWTGSERPRIVLTHFTAFRRCGPRVIHAGKLPPGYFTGVEDPTHFDARCTRFLGVNYDELAKRTLQGGSDDEILEWCFARGRRPSDEEISVWNAFLRKRGWRDEASEELAESKKEAGFGDRDDIQTWMDLHDAEDGRTPAVS